MFFWGGDGYIQSNFIGYFDGLNEIIVCDLYFLSKVKNIFDKFCFGMFFIRYFYYEFFLILFILYCLRFVFKFFLLQFVKQMKVRKIYYLISIY